MIVQGKLQIFTYKQSIHRKRVKYQLFARPSFQTKGGTVKNQVISMNVFCNSTIIIYIYRFKPTAFGGFSIVMSSN